MTTLLILSTAPIIESNAGGAKTIDSPVKNLAQLTTKSETKGGNNKRRLEKLKNVTSVK